MMHIISKDSGNLYVDNSSQATFIVLYYLNYCHILWDLRNEHVKYLSMR
jgi:hypothetical protein